MRRIPYAITICFPLLLAACDLSRQEVAPPYEPSREPAFRLLIVEETSDRPRMLQSQQAIFTSVRLRNYLKMHCAKGPDGAAAFRFLDKDAELSGDWRMTLRARPQRSYPWLYVTNGSHGYSGPLPASVDELLVLIRQYAEPQ